MIFLLLALTLQAAGQTSDDPGTRIDAVFARYRDTPGCAVAVARDGSPLLTRGYGMANLEYDISITGSTIFEAGSVSKQFTAASIVLLAQDGKLSLDDRVRKYIPELSDAADSVTIRQMLNHTSGFRDWGTLAELSGWPRGTRAHTHANVLDILSRQRGLNFPAGTQYSYSNSNYNLAAIIVERISGKPFPTFTRERIFGPLGMTHSGWRDDYSRVVKGRANAYEPAKENGFRTSMHYENIYGNCCLMTTVGDLLLWNENFRSGKVGGRALVETMQTRGVLKSGETIDYALGLFIGEYNGKREINHGGATAGYRAFLTRLPDDDLSIAVLCNRGDANATTLAHRVADVFLGPAAAPSRSPATTSDLPHAGLYRDVQSGALLPIQVTGSSVRLGFDRSFELTPLGNGRYRIRPGNEVQFENDGLLLFTGHKPPARYVAVSSASPSAAALEEYAGVYASDEADAKVRLSVSAGKLVVHVRPGLDVPLSPTDADGFQFESSYLLHFTRNARERVDGFDIAADFSMSEGTGRVARLHFTRQ